MARYELPTTDRKIDALPRAAKSERREYFDASTPGFGLRVTETGNKTYFVRTRIRGGDEVVRRTLGRAMPMDSIARRDALTKYEASEDREALTFDQYLAKYFGATTLAGARQQARAWLDSMKRGVDPKSEERDRLAAAQRRRKTTFGAVAENFIAEKVSKERRRYDVEREIRNDLKEWWGRPITEITDDDVAALIKKKARDAPAQARNLLATIKRFFQWAIDQREYGLKASPAAGLKPASLCGERISRDRILSDDELIALWRAAENLGYPHGTVYKTLILSALRLNEVADAENDEIDERKKTWTLPAKRMKGKNGSAREHVVPLIDDMVAILAEVPKIKGSKFLFSTTHGDTPVWVGDKIKKKLCGLMLPILKELTETRGDDASKVKIKPWRNHDIRRTVRSHLSRLKVADHVAEAVLAHVRPGIKGVYDRYQYLDEKRDALTLWAAELKRLIDPKSVGNNIVRIGRGKK